MVGNSKSDVDFFNHLGVGIKKDKEYFETVCQHIASQAYGDDAIRSNISNLRKRYNLFVDQNEYESIYNPLIKKIKDEQSNDVQTIKAYKNPIQIKSVPILRSRISGLISEEYLRPIDYKIAATDIISNQQKMKAYADMLFNEQMDRLQARKSFLDQQQQNMQLQAQLQSEQAGSLPPDQKEAYLQQLQMMYEETQLRLQQAVILNDKELKAMRKRFEKTYLTNEELFCEAVVDWFMDFSKFKTITNTGFREKLINDNEIYFVDFDYSSKHPTVRCVPRERLWLPNNDGVPRIHQLDCAAELSYMSVDNILAEFNHRINKEDMKQIVKNYSSGFQLPLTLQNTTFDGQLMTSWGTLPVNTNENYSNMTLVTRCYWKCVENQYYKVVKSKNAGGPDVWYQMSEDEYNSESKRKTDKFRLEKRYRTDLCSGVVLNNEHILYADLHNVQVRLTDNYTTNWLPYVGKNNSLLNPTLSIFQIGSDIQDTINVLYYQVTLLVVLSGVKGLVYDLSQKPLNMELSEIMYYRSQGLTLIQTMEKGEQRSTFNQFQTYDDGVSNSLNTILALIENYKSVLNEVIGVPDSRVAIIDNSARVGNTMHQYRQSLVVTESLFVEHEETIEDVLTRLAMLMKVSYADGYDFGQYYSSKEGYTKMLTLPASVLTSDFKVNISVGRDESENIKTLKEIAKKKLEQGQLKDSQFLEIMAARDYRNLGELIKGYEDDFEQMLAAKEQRSAEMQQQVQAQIAERDAKMTQFVEQMKSEREKEKNAVALQKMQLEKYIKESEIATWNKDIDVKAEVAMESIQKDSEIEMAYLQQRYDQSIKQVQQNNKNLLFGEIARKIEQQQPKEKIKD